MRYEYKDMKKNNFCKGYSLLAAVLAVSAISVVPSCAEEVVVLDLSDKSIDTPTLNYLKGSNQLIPQKGAWDSSTKTWGEAPSIASPGSSYEIVTGSEINLHNIETNIRGSKNIKWTKLDSAKEDSAIDVITVKYSDNGSDYYKYELVDGNYKIVTNRVNNSSSAGEDINNKVFFEINESRNVGGAIYNTGIIGNVNSDFIGNVASDTKFSKGGAIYNNGTIGNIIGDFIDNNAVGTSSYGGAIYNDRSTIKDIVGNFINNSAVVSGGAIYNYGKTSLIGDIDANFINNSVQGAYGSGGAIHNSGTIGDINGHFINNSAVALSPTNAQGGAILNTSAIIGNVTGDFINNSTTGTRAYGGAIYNYTDSSAATPSIIGNITGDFVNNSASGGTSAYGGAIYNYTDSMSTPAIIGDITAILLIIQ